MSMSRESAVNSTGGPGEGSGRAGMVLKIGVMGGATGAISPELLDKAHQLGRAVVRNGCVLIPAPAPRSGLRRQARGRNGRRHPAGAEPRRARRQVQLARRVPRRADLHWQRPDGTGGRQHPQLRHRGRRRRAKRHARRVGQRRRPSGPWQAAATCSAPPRVRRASTPTL